MPINVQTLINNAACLCGVDKNELLRIIAANVAQGCGGGSCANLEGVSDDPTGIVTPDFNDQIYQGTNTIWQATGLTASDWTLLVDFRVLTFNDATLSVFSLEGDGYHNAINMPNLTEITNLVIGFSPGMTLSVPLLNYVGNNLGLSGDMPAVMDFSLVTAVDGSIAIENSGTMTDLDLSMLATFGPGGLNILNNAVLTALDFSSLISGSGDVQILGNAMLPGLSMPSLTTVTGSFSCASNAALVAFSAPNWLPTDGTSITFAGDALDDTSVNHILARCVAAAVTTCVIDLSGGTNAAPTGQGAIDKADLITAGCTVVTN